MNNQIPHIASFDTSTDAGVKNILQGVEQIMNGATSIFNQSIKEKEQYRKLIEMHSIAPTCIVAEGCQSDIIVVLNTMFEAGFITGNKKDFMQRIADALGCPGIADYSKQLYKAKWTNKYSEIFTKLAEVAEQEKLKDN